MKQSGWNGLLLAGAVVPLVLLLWPFAWWGGGMRLVLRVVSAVCIQLFLCHRGRWSAVTYLPLAATGILALWGTWLYVTSPHWAGATWTGLVADYHSPFLSCAAVLGLVGAIRFGAKNNN